jgi:hypothetical protein
MEERFFGLHHDLAPETIARELGGTLVWKREDHGMWIGLIRFERRLNARVEDGAELETAMGGAQ